MFCFEDKRSFMIKTADNDNRDHKQRDKYYINQENLFSRKLHSFYC